MIIFIGKFAAPNKTVGSEKRFKRGFNRLLIDIRF